MSRRTVALIVLVAWAAGIVAFARRELSHSSADRLSEAALRVAPGATFFAVERGGAHVGFASTTIDTLPGVLQVTDYLVVDVDVGGTTQRATAQTVVRLSRRLALRDFDARFTANASPVRVRGTLGEDSVLTLVIQTGGGTARADTQRIPVRGPVLVPTLVPIAAALGERLKVGRDVTLGIFDPATRSAKPMRLAVRAESLFTVTDSAAYDADRGSWHTAHSDTVRAWRLVSAPEGSMDVWVDDHGQVVLATAPAGFSLRRMAYEMAFENWRSASPLKRNVAGRDDIYETTAIAANLKQAESLSPILRYRISGIPLDRFALDGGAQRLAADTVIVSRVSVRDTRGRWSLPLPADLRERFTSSLGKAPLLETDAPEIVTLARRLQGDITEPGTVVLRLYNWARDSIVKAPSLTIPSALQVLRERRGDCNEHTQLFVALARAAGIPARAASGLVYLRGKFYYHAWPEVWLGEWVGVDPTLGAYPVTASYLRLLTGGLGAQMELLRAIDRLQIDVLPGE